MKPFKTTCLTLLLAATSAFAEKPAEETSSPYFQIHGDHRADSFPLKKSHAEVSIAGTIARVTLTQTYTNEGEVPLDATYLFPASTGAAVNGMTMSIGDRVLIAKIHEKKDARKKFEQAKADHKSASLLTQHRPNLFQMEVARILPGDVVSLTLRYSELLKPVENTYEFVLPTAIGPRFTGEAKTENFTANPFLAQGESTPAKSSVNLTISTPLDLQNLSCPSHQTKINFTAKNQATLTLPPAAPDRDFIVRYQLAEQKIASGLLLHQGPDENFFVLQVEPPSRVSDTDIPTRDYVFLIDVSGSMEGFPLNLAKKLFRDLIGTLRPTDTFNVVLFAGSRTVLSASPLAANQSNLEKAIRLLDSHGGGGGTQLLEGLKTALALPADRDISRSLILITDGFISAEPEAFELVRNGAKGTNLFPLGVGSSVNRHLIEGLAHLAGNDSFIVTNSSETPAAVTRFREVVSSPVLTGLTIKTEGFETTDLQPAALPDLFANRPLTLIGKWKGEPTGTIELSGITGKGKTVTRKFQIADQATNLANPALRVLWAREKIRALADYAELTEQPKLIKEVTDLGLRYELLTPYTSFLAIDETPRDPETESLAVTQPQPLPSGVSNSAIATGNTPSGSVPEPDTILLLALLTLTATFLRIRRK